jgi:hypothetical protein
MIYGSEVKKEVTAIQCFYKAIGDRWYKILLSVFIIVVISVVKFFVCFMTSDWVKKIIKNDNVRYVIYFSLNVILITGLSYIRVYFVSKNQNTQTKIKALLILVAFVYLVRLIGFCLFWVIGGSQREYLIFIPFGTFLS